MKEREGVWLPKEVYATAMQCEKRAMRSRHCAIRELFPGWGINIRIVALRVLSLISNCIVLHGSGKDRDGLKIHVGDTSG